MPMPKSVTKINKNGVTYISDVDRAQYTLKELIKAALRDSLKIARYTAKRNAPKDQGTYKRNIATWVREDRNTGEIEGHIGIYSKRTSKKKNIPPAGFYAHIIEFGSRFVRGKHIIRNSVFNNLQQIQATQARYLSYMEDEQKAKTLIDERDEETNEG